MRHREAGSEGAAGERRALVVAVSEYPDPANRLPYCIRDAEAMTGLLREVYGVTRIQRLLDHEATVARVEEALAGLIPEGESESVGLFYFSGHGCQREQEDVFQECLALYDGFLLDDRFVALTADLPGTLVGILDCCFSGGLPQAFAEEEEPGWRRPKSFTLPFQSFSGAEPLPRRAFGTGRWVSPAGLAIASFGDSEETFPGVLLSACGKDEIASTGDPGTDFISPFTYALQRAARLEPRRSYGTLMEAAHQEVQRLDCPQTPTLWTPPSRPWLARGGFLQPAEPERQASR